jgi:antitoxin (DNA-binding transcriptional repressor) of toxin-antitoxin stability system
MTVQVNVYEAKTNLSKLLERVQQGERVIISKNGKPVADLVFHEPNKVIFGGMKGEIEFDDDEFEAADAEVAAMFDPELEIEIESRDAPA